jgi:hypothetical protein
MGEPLRHRQTKGAATDMFSLQPPRHIPDSTLNVSAEGSRLRRQLNEQRTRNAGDTPFGP